MKLQDSNYNKKFWNSALVYIFPVVFLIFAVQFQYYTGLY